MAQAAGGGARQGTGAEQQRHVAGSGGRCLARWDVGWKPEEISTKTVVFESDVLGIFSISGDFWICLGDFVEHGFHGCLDNFGEFHGILEFC